MAKVCSVCSLPSELLDAVEARLDSGVSYRVLAGWLGEQGYKISTNMISNHKANHYSPQSQTKNALDQTEIAPSSHVQLQMGSSELIKANIKDAIALSQQLQALNQPTNLRVSRVLVEHLANLHKMLTDVAFEADSDAG